MSGFCIKFLLFIKNFNFSNFQSIECIFRPIENAFKILVWICLARLVLNWCLINRIYFSINRTPISTDWNSKVKSFKKLIPHVFFSISKAFQAFSYFLSSINPLWGIFVVFFHKFLQGFCPQALVRLLYHFFFNLITCFMHFHAFFFFWKIWT